jgi:hypothetical protein
MAAISLVLFALRARSRLDSATFVLLIGLGAGAVSADAGGQRSRSRLSPSAPMRAISSD